MDWCEARGVDYVFGLTGTKALAAKVEVVADDIRVERAIEDRDAVRGFAETTHAAKSWKRERRVSARILGVAEKGTLKALITSALAES